jgi:hypothetical protein
MRKNMLRNSTMKLRSNYTLVLLSIVFLWLLWSDMRRTSGFTAGGCCGMMA